MFTIKQASARTGVPVASLRAWERRYGVVAPRRTESGYRLYDEQAIAALSAMRRLVDQGWTPASAAEAITSGEAGRPPEPEPARPSEDPQPRTHPEAEALTHAFLDAARAVDLAAIESVIDRGFALATFETAVDTWLMPTLRALGDAWEDGTVDVAGEHMASYAVMRRLGQAFAAASSLTAGRRILVGLPSGSHHELGALAFATAARRRGLAVVYVGADLPVESWRRAVQAFPTKVAVLAVPTAEDQPKAEETARALRRTKPDLVVAVGGSHAGDVGADVVRLPDSITDAARAVRGLGL